MKDPYVYKGTTILVNTLNIKEYARLEFVEKEITTVRLKDIGRGLLTEGFYDVDHYKQFHHYIFGDIYPWAEESVPSISLSMKPH
jgi:cell filamentation protein